MTVMNRIATFAAFACLASASVTVLADEHAYTEGPVVSVSRIRTVDGKFDEYMNWIGTKWKQQQEFAKKAGYIVSYAAYKATPHSPQDADVLLVITYKNWAAMDGALARGDAAAKEVMGSVTAANQAQVERAKLRTLLGADTIQEMLLK